MVAGIDAQHLHTRDHSENVASYAVAIGQALGLEPARIVKLRLAALLHDIGKVAVDDGILSKPSGLTDDEVAQIRVHPEIGATMLNHAGLREESRWVRHHHERMDGRGYPDGLAGHAIPLESRVLFVADAFEAMTSDRPYRRGMPVPDAVAELRTCAGSQFDPAVVDVLEALIANERLAVLALRDAA
jgi:putative nucleotidyltransferase with HDIG domain